MGGKRNASCVLFVVTADDKTRVARIFAAGFEWSVCELWGQIASARTKLQSSGRYDEVAFRARKNHLVEFAYRRCRTFGSPAT
jgi:hypothetical protein